MFTLIVSPFNGEKFLNFQIWFSISIFFVINCSYFQHANQIAIKHLNNGKSSQRWLKRRGRKKTKKKTTRVKTATWKNGNYMEFCFFFVLHFNFASTVNAISLDFCLIHEYSSNNISYAFYFFVFVFCFSFYLLFSRHIFNACIIFLFYICFCLRCR